MAQWQNFSSPGERAGLALIATAGLASALTTFSLLVYIIWYSFISTETTTPLARGVRAFTRSSLGSYLISLLFCDFIQGVAFTMNYRWAAIGHMQEGTLCTIQGAVSEVGDLGAALWSIAISFHTFSLLFLVQKPHRLAAPIALTLGWSALVVLPIAGPTLIQSSHRGRFYGLSGAWCWVATNYDKERLLYLYIWVFIALGSSFVIYTLIYLRFSNYITYGEDGKLTFSFRRRHLNKPVPPSVSQATGSVSQSGPARSTRCGSKSLPGCFDWMKDTRDGTTSTNGSSTDPTHAIQPQVGKHLKQVARRLMWYPFMYAIVVIPASICRMGVLAGWTPPFGLFVFAGICFSGSGVSNVLLFIFTRHSFIRQVANTRGTRVVITTQRITMREDATDGVEMRDLNRMDGYVSPKSPFYIRSESEAGTTTATKEKVTLDEESTNDSYEAKGGIHISVFGK